MEWRAAWTTENYALRNKAREAGKKREGRKEKRREEKMEGRETQAGPLAWLAIKSLYHVTGWQKDSHWMLSGFPASRALS